MVDSAEFIQIISNDGDVSFLNLNCQVIHLHDQIAELCRIFPDNEIDLASDKGRLQDFNVAVQTQPTELASAFLKSKSVFVPVLVQVLDDDISTTSRPTSSKKKEDSERKVNYQPLLNQQMLQARFPYFELQLSTGKAVAKRAPSRRASTKPPKK
eukprot:m.20449 g.20449  ORF g.20449 m.20449 type:complete len:155 (+) comp8168_c0_seq1:926-1390(+)